MAFLFESTIRMTENRTIGRVLSDVEALSLVAHTNRRLEQAGRHFRGHGVWGRQIAIRLINRFIETAAALESCNWSVEQIREHLRPSRRVFATSSFIRRCQEWPRGYAGDFETIEYLTAGSNSSVPGTLGWHIEQILLESPVVQQHRNKLESQSLAILRAIGDSANARVLSMACGGCLDWLPVLRHLNDFKGEVVLNDFDAAALELAERRLQSATTRYRLAPGNVIRVARHLASGPRFDLIVAGGLFDYLPHQATVLLLRMISRDLLARGGVLLFTNIAEGNPWRPLMEYAADWTLIERSERLVIDICNEAGVATSSVSVRRETTGLTLITTVVQ